MEQLQPQSSGPKPARFHQLHPFNQRGTPVSFVSTEKIRESKLDLNQVAESSCQNSTASLPADVPDYAKKAAHMEYFAEVVAQQCQHFQAKEFSEAQDRITYLEKQLAMQKKCWKQLLVSPRVERLRPHMRDRRCPKQMQRQGRRMD